MNRFSAVRLLVIPMLLCTWGGCSGEEKTPEGLLPEDQYVEVMVELQLIESYRLSSSKDSVNVDSLKQLVYKEHGTSEQQFKVAHEFYQQQIDKQKERITRAIVLLRKESAGLSEKTDSLNLDLEEKTDSLE